MVVAGLGEGEWGITVTGHRVSVGKYEKILEMDGGDGCTAM